jgi:hypothetical protein
MFGSGPDQLSGYCPQVPTMFSSSAAGMLFRTCFAYGLTTNVPRSQREVTRSDRRCSPFRTLMNAPFITATMLVRGGVDKRGR